MISEADLEDLDLPDISLTPSNSEFKEHKR